MGTKGIRFLIVNKNLFEIGLLLLSLFYLFSSVNLQVGELSRPGPGFLPIVLGVAGVASASLLLVGSFQRRKRAKEKEDLLSQDKEARKGVIRIFGYIAALAVLIALYETLGSLVGFLALSIVFGKISGIRGWIRPLILGLCTSISIYLVFGVWFRIPLPGGFLDKLF